MDIALRVDTSKWLVDPETGMLDPTDQDTQGGAWHPILFNANRKTKVLAFLLRTWNISKACASVNISRFTHANHYNLDPAYRECVDLIHETWIDGIDNVRHEVAMKPSGVLDRMAVLNAYRKDTYNPKQVIAIEQTVTHEVVLGRAKNLGKVVEAKLVKGGETE